MSYGGTANVKKCSAWAVKSIWKRDFQPHEQASVFETIYEVSLLVIVPLPANCMSGFMLHVHAWGSSIVCKHGNCTVGRKATSLLSLLWPSNVMI